MRVPHLERDWSLRNLCIPLRFRSIRAGRHGCNFPYSDLAYRARGAVQPQRTFLDAVWIRRIYKRGADCLEILARVSAGKISGMGAR